MHPCLADISEGVGACGSGSGSGGPTIHPAELIGASGFPGFGSFFGLFGRFWSESGPRGSVWPEISFVNATLTRRSHPHSPEASQIIVIFRIEHF